MNLKEQVKNKLSKLIDSEYKYSNTGENLTLKEIEILTNLLEVVNGKQYWEWCHTKDIKINNPYEDFKISFL